MTAQSDKGDGRALKTFGWQGIRVTIPTGWDLVSTRGSYESGYACLADETEVRLEMKWESVSGRPSPSETATRYIRELRKRAKKERAPLAVKRGIKLAAPKGKEVECYDWTAAARGAGMVSRCDECGRLVHLVVLGKRGESLRKIARTVFSSLRDHAEDDQLLWSFYDVEFSSPRAMPLQRQELKPGCIRMHFQKRSRRLEFVRVSMVRFVLAHKSLREWFTGFYAGELKRWSYNISETTIKSHPGLCLEGKAWLIVNPVGLLGRRREIRVACWHCERSNRLFLVRHSGPRREGSVFDVAAQSIACCTEE